MSLQRKLFLAWCGFTLLWWLWGLTSDGHPIALKFQIGGMRGAYVHLMLTLVIAVGAPLVVLLTGWGALRLYNTNFKSGHS